MRKGRFGCLNDKLPVIGAGPDAPIRTGAQELREAQFPKRTHASEAVRERGGMRIFSCAMKGHFGASSRATDSVGDFRPS